MVKTAESSRSGRYVSSAMQKNTRANAPLTIVRKRNPSANFWRRSGSGSSGQGRSSLSSDEDTTMPCRRVRKANGLEEQLVPVAELPEATPLRSARRRRPLRSVGTPEIAELLQMSRERGFLVVEES